jgi:hypothetical protein
VKNTGIRVHVTNYRYSLSEGFGRVPETKQKYGIIFFNFEKKLTFDGIVPLFEMYESIVLDLLNPFHFSERFKTLPER